MKLTRPVLVVIGVAGLLMVGTVPAQASTAAEADEIYCAVEVTATPDADTTPASPYCFTAESEVTTYLESVGVVDPGTANRGVAANTVVGTVYKDANRGGGSLTFFGASGCAGVTFGFPSLASGWDNSISSVEGSNGCWLTLYTATNYGSARLNCTAYCASVGTWNDRVQSLVFRPTGTFG